MEKQPTLKDKVQKFYKNPCYDTFNKLDRNLIAYRLVLERNIKEFFRLEDWILTYLNIHEFKVTAKIEIRKMVQ
ncbi:MAG: hypothetical protein LBI53_02785 [Candidatus Peribacteria bacterium]|jgi:hypothetical protein|nr:hypothetical protein [Candidatus Peribacteria bacterium]